MCELKGFSAIPVLRKEVPKIEKELHWLDDILTRLKETCNYDAEVLEYGPGFYILILKMKMR